VIKVSFTALVFHDLGR